MTNGERAKRWQDAKRAAGLCASCGIRALATSYYCRECADKRMTTPIDTRRLCGTCGQVLRKGARKAVTSA